MSHLPPRHSPAGRRTLYVVFFGAPLIGYLLFAAIAGFSPLSPLATTAHAQTLSGPMTRAVDGDTFDLNVRGQIVRFRLCGIDAPERGMPGSAQATALIAGMVGEVVQCVPVGAGTPCDGRSRTMNRGRVVAQCFIGDADIARLLVERGLARDWPKFSGGYYGRF